MRQFHSVWLALVKFSNKSKPFHHSVSTACYCCLALVLPCYLLLSIIAYYDTLRYTGHCPTLKFRFGKRYGANTLEIIQELREKGVLKQCDLKNIYLRDSPLDELLPKSSANNLKINIDKQQEISVNNYQKYILGYTGYIPGMHFRYGKTFCKLAQECEENMLVKLSLEQSRKAVDRPVRFLPPKMVPDKANMRLQHTLNKYKKSKDFKDHKVSSELPPIAGYTGHIPRLKVSNISVSLPFHHSAKLGLSDLKQKNDNAVKEYSR